MFIGYSDTANDEKGVRADVIPRVYLLRGWLHSLGPAAASLRSVSITVGRWVTGDEGVDPEPQLVGWVIKRAEDIFASTTVVPPLWLIIDWCSFSDDSKHRIRLPPLPALYDDDNVRYFLDALARAYASVRALSDSAREELLECRDQGREPSMALRGGRRSFSAELEDEWQAVRDAIVWSQREGGEETDQTVVK